ncbi:amidohydrolase family protein [Streptomyces kanamyceticus]|uniref:amidohydrolase family protein n=1 Tax=Streptomyces kanamyceticus TaxID=1967 RepID=UPI0037DDA41B
MYWRTTCSARTSPPAGWPHGPPWTPATASRSTTTASARPPTRSPASPPRSRAAATRAAGYTDPTNASPSRRPCAVTADPAWQLHLENDIGMLRPGMRADLNVLTTDPRTAHPDRFQDEVAVTATCLGGRQTWS